MVVLPLVPVMPTTSSDERRTPVHGVGRECEGALSDRSTNITGTGVTLRIERARGGHHGRRAAPHRVVDEPSPVDVASLTRHEEIARAHAPRIVADPLYAHVCVPRDASALGEFAREFVEAHIRSGPAVRRPRHDEGSSTTRTELPLGAALPAAGVCRTTRPQPSIWATKPALLSAAMTS